MRKKNVRTEMLFVLERGAKLDYPSVVALAQDVSLSLDVLDFVVFLDEFLVEHLCCKLLSCFFESDKHHLFIFKTNLYSLYF